MYIMITSRCNMRCPHCCYECNELGMDMPKEVYERAVRLANTASTPIAIGGGEPTLHPKFWEYIGIALKWQAEPEEFPVWLATNGSRTNDSIQLAHLARAGILAVALSLDQWHDPIEDSALKAFGAFENKRNSYRRMIVGYDSVRNDLREIRDVGDAVALQGRARENDLYSETPDNCVCNDIFVKPNGDVYECGCQTHYMGNVFQSWLELLDHVEHMEMFACSRERHEKEEEKDV